MKHLETGLYGNNSFWRYLGMTLIIFLGVSTVGAIPLMIVIFTKIFSNGGNIENISKNMMDFSQFGISNNLGLFLMLLSFIACFFAFKWLIKPMHQRTFMETINGGGKFRWNHFRSGIIVWGGIWLISMIIDYSKNPQNYIYQFDATKFTILALIVILLLPFQTSFEEIFFRGYLSQGIAQRFKNRWVVLIVIAVAFGLMHISNPEIKQYGFVSMMPSYIIMGLILGFASILDDGIEVAMGMHFINNATAALFITNKASVLQTDAVFEVTNVNPKMDTIYLIIAGIISIYILAKIYKWDFSIMNKNIEPITPPIPDSFLSE